MVREEDKKNTTEGVYKRKYIIERERERERGRESSESNERERVK